MSRQEGHYGIHFRNQSQNRRLLNNVGYCESQNKNSESDEDVVTEEHVFNIDKCESFDSANLLTLKTSMRIVVQVLLNQYIK